MKQQQVEQNLVIGFSDSNKSSTLSLGIFLRYLMSACQENEIISKKLRLIKALYIIKLRSSGLIYILPFCATFPLMTVI